MQRISAEVSTRIAAITPAHGDLIPSASATSVSWTKRTIPHFDLNTAAGAKKGREAILYFEQMRRFLQRMGLSKRQEVPVGIAALRSEGQYKPYRANDGWLTFDAQNCSSEFIGKRSTAGIMRGLDS